MPHLIDADALIAYCDKNWIPLNVDAVNAQPTIQPERKTGRWIIDPGIGCKCSVCDFEIGNDLDFMEYVNFCPNCGADMRGEE